MCSAHRDGCSEPQLPAAAQTPKPYSRWDRHVCRSARTRTPSCPAPRVGPCVQGVPDTLRQARTTLHLLSPPPQRARVSYQLSPKPCASRHVAEASEEPGVLQKRPQILPCSPPAVGLRLACAEPWGSQGVAQAKLGDPFGHTGTEVVPAHAVRSRFLPSVAVTSPWTRPWHPAVAGGPGSGPALLTAFAPAGPRTALLAACSGLKAPCVVNAVDSLTSHATRIPLRRLATALLAPDTAQPFRPRLGPL